MQEGSSLQKLDFGTVNRISPTQVERVASYFTADGQPVQVVATHKKSKLESKLVNELLTNVQIQVMIQAVDSLPEIVQDRLKKAPPPDDIEVENEGASKAPDVEFKLRFEKLATTQKYYRVNFKIDPPISRVGSSPQHFHFGDGEAVSIDADVTSTEGTITAQVHPHAYTRNPQTIPPGDCEHLGAQDERGTTFTIWLDGTGRYRLEGEYYTK